MAVFGASCDASPPTDAAGLIRPDEISTLLAHHREQQSKRSRSARATTGCRSVDEALEGGLERGIRGLCCVSGERGAGKTGLALAFLASHLLEDPQSNAAIIDTSGNFDVLRLHSTLLSRLQQNVVPQHRQPDSISPSPEPDEIATKVLERVRIMRVFDFVGVKEALEELKEEISQASEKFDSKTIPHTTPSTSKPRDGRRVQVADSEDDLSEDGEEEEMLFVGMSRPETMQTHRKEERRHLSPDISADEGGGGTWMLIVDNITQVLSPLMKTKYVQAHAMLVSLMRDLTQLARSHDLTSLIINSGITRHPPPTPAADPRPEGPDASLNLQHYFMLSAFEACTTYPALGKTFPFLVDMHFLVSRLPKDRRDAKSYYKSAEQAGDGNHSGQRAAEMVHVVEVLSDGWDGRAGRLAAFQCSDKGGLESVPYGSHS